MKIIKIPDNLNDCRDLTEFSKSISEINKFNRKIEEFASAILKDKFLKTGKEILKYLSATDLDIYVSNYFGEMLNIKAYVESKRIYNLRYNNPQLTKEEIETYNKKVRKEHKIACELFKKTLSLNWSDLHELRKNNNDYLVVDIDGEKITKFINNHFGDSYFLLNVKEKNIEEWHLSSGITSMGESTGTTINYSFSDNGKVLKISKRWKTKSARFDHIPWSIHECQFEINIITGKMSGWKYV